MAPAPPRVKPRLRGVFHEVAFFVAVPARIVLVLVAHTGAARLAAVVYALSLAGLYGTSTLYHRLPWSPRSLRWMSSAAAGRGGTATRSLTRPDHSASRLSSRYSTSFSGDARRHSRTAASSSGDASPLRERVKRGSIGRPPA